MNIRALRSIFIKKDIFVLEYNEKQGGFHYNYVDSEFDTHGWNLVSICESTELANKFTTLWKEKHRGVDWNGENNPSLNTVRREYIFFLLTGRI